MNEEMENVVAQSEEAPVEETPVQAAETAGEEAAQERAEAAPTEDAPAEEKPAEVKAEPVVSIDFLEVKKLIHAHYVNVVTFLKYNKDKDANVNKLTKQMNAYREGLEATMFKSLAINVIGYRESCQKALRDLETREFGVEEFKKYLRYLNLDFQDLLSELGVEEKEPNKWTYNGKDLNADVAKGGVDESVPEVTYTPLPIMQVNSVEEMAAYLKASEELIQKTLQTNAVLDKTLGNYIEYCSLYEKGVYQVALYPVIRKLIKMGNELQEVCVELSEEATADDYKEQYVKTLEYAVEESENVLALCNVMIESEGLEKFDGKKHRMLKAIKTEDPALNGVVAKKYCDCYSMDDKIIYPSKVDVYRV